MRGAGAWEATAGSLAGARRRPAPLALALVASAWLGTGCSSVDSLGWNGPGGITLHPIAGPDSYPNPFHDLLGKTDAEIAAKIAAAFAQLFHGDAGGQAIYFTTGTDQAYIQDIYHGDVRTEGVSLVMLICVELDKRDEFDRLWRYAKAMLAVSSGPEAGYFNSFCQIQGTNNWESCLDPFGLEQFVMALLLANDRWSGAAATLDYAADVKALLTVMRHKQDTNGGIVDGVTDSFDAAWHLPFDIPDASAAGRSRPSIVMPGYYELWGRATDDPFWSAAASSGRTFFRDTAHPTTGLMPVRALFDGSPFPAGETSGPQTFIAQLAITLDRIWTGGDPWQDGESDRLLQFYTAQGLDQYGSAYHLEGGAPVDGTHDPALVAMNGASAVIGTTDQRVPFVNAVWNLATPTGPLRYYAGLLDLLALLVCGGQLRVY